MIDKNILGFHWRSGPSFYIPLDGGYEEKVGDEFDLGVPGWFPVAFFGLLTLLLVHKRPRRQVAGLCPACGYDLRATPNQCPECGRIPLRIELV
jgi:hypothetical protein